MEKEFILGEGERLEDLQCRGLKIIQNKNLYTFSSDSVILANFVRTKRGDFAVEIGTGCGVISILVQAKCALKKILAFEIQPPLASLAQKNVQFNNLSQKIEVAFNDAQNFENHFPKGSADVVFCNPPYFLPTNFPQNPVRKAAREEVCLCMSALCKTAKEMLKDGGAFYLCYPCARTAELFFTLCQNNLQPKEMFFTENGHGQVKTLFVKAVKGGKSEILVHPNLQTNDSNGNYLSALHTKNFLN